MPVRVLACPILSHPKTYPGQDEGNFFSFSLFFPKKKKKKKTHGKKQQERRNAAVRSLGCRVRSEDLDAGLESKY